MSVYHPAGYSQGYDGLSEPDPRDVPESRLLSSRSSIAAKRHRCDCCREPILPGQRYHREVVIYDSEFQVSRMHEGCPPC